MLPVFTAGNQLTLLDSGAEFFPAVLAAMALAQREIHLESYIYADDATGQAITVALCQAAARGVRVCVLVDGFGARDLAKQFSEQFAGAGVALRVYGPPSLLRPVHGLRRLHRKLIAIDQVVAFIGGINIIDDYNAPPGMAPRRDLAIRAQGPFAAHVAQAMHSLWLRAGLRTLSPARLPAIWREQPQAAQELSPPILLADETSMRAALVRRDNLRHRRDIERAYLTAIEAAKHEIVIASAYFFPSGRFRRALMRSARRGVAVTLLLQGPSDHPLHKAAEIHLYRILLGAGVQIVEYQTSFLHAKAAVIDARWATVGSSNIDPFSLWLSHEANLVSDDARLAQQLRTKLGQWIAEHGREVSVAGLGRRTRWSRLLHWLAFHLTRRVAQALNLHDTRDR